MQPDQFILTERYDHGEALNVGNWAKDHRTVDRHFIIGTVTQDVDF